MIKFKKLYIKRNKIQTKKAIKMNVRMKMKQNKIKIKNR